MLVEMFRGMFSLVIGKDIGFLVLIIVLVIYTSRVILRYIPGLNSYANNIMSDILMIALLILVIGYYNQVSVVEEAKEIVAENCDILNPTKWKNCF